MFCRVLIEMDFCTVVIQLLNTVVIDSTVQLLTGILWKVSLDESSRKSVAEGVDSIVHSLQTYPTHAGIQRNCLGMLFNLSLSGRESEGIGMLDTRICSLLYSRLTLPCILDSMDYFKGDSQVSLQGVSLLCNLLKGMYEDSYSMQMRTAVCFFSLIMWWS